MSDSKPRGKGGRFAPSGEISDLSRYAQGATDDAARAAHTQDVRKRRAAASEAAGVERPAADDKWDKPHSVNLSARVDAIIKPLLGDGTWGEWIRGAVLERLARELGIDPEDLDTARRPVQRRANYSRRQQREEGQQG